MIGAAALGGRWRGFLRGDVGPHAGASAAMLGESGLEEMKRHQK
jgi:hypothetical protein